MTFVTRRAKKKTIPKNEKAQPNPNQALQTEIYTRKGLGIAQRNWNTGYSERLNNKNFRRKSSVDFSDCFIDHETGVVFASISRARVEGALRVRLALFSAWLKNAKEHQA